MRLIRYVVVALHWSGMLLLRPLSFIWSTFLAPIVIRLYKYIVIIRKRWDRFMHAQHKILAIVTHRWSIHVLMIALTVAIVGMNVVQAQTVRSDDFLQQTLVADIVRPGTDIKITSETVTATETSYIDTSAVVRNVPTIDPDAVQQATAIAAIGGAAVTAPVGTTTEAGVVATAEDTTPQKRSEILQYTVQSGDTASTIAARFGITTSTVLSTNNLSDASLIQPGDTLYILPTSGVAYTVENGDTIEEIAGDFSAKTEEILAFNGMASGQELIAGKEIVIPGGTRPAPVQAQLATISDVFGGGSVEPSTSPTAAPQPSAAPSTGTLGRWPASCSRISQYYGAFHTGIDIDCEFGDPIYASEDGVVTSAGWNGAYGNSVKISHPSGRVTHYAHMQVISVGVGQSVGSGQYLGEMGSTGRSSGSHLHFECLIGGRFVNPYSCVQ